MTRRSKGSLPNLFRAGDRNRRVLLCKPAACLLTKQSTALRCWRQESTHFSLCFAVKTAPSSQDGTCSLQHLKTCLWACFLNGAARGFDSVSAIKKERVSTRLSLSWCWRQESNLRPTDYESVALPTVPLQHVLIRGTLLYYIELPLELQDLNERYDFHRSSYKSAALS